MSKETFTLNELAQAVTGGNLAKMAAIIQDAGGPGYNRKPGQIPREWLQDLATQRAGDRVGKRLSKLLAETQAPAPYELLSDAAAALVKQPKGRDLDAAISHLASELVALGVDVGLSLGELRGLAVRLGSDLTDAIVREVDR